MPDLVRGVVAGGLVLAAVFGAVACWSLAPDSANEGYLETGSDVIITIEGATVVEAETDDTGSSSGDDGGGDDGGPGSDAEGAAPLVVVPTASPSIAAGMAFGCEIDGNGAVWCWGNNQYGQSGSAPSAAGITQPQLVPGITNATWIALGDYHACAVTSSQAVYCWGLNGSYQLGHAAATSGDLICPGAVPCTATPTVVQGIPAAVAVAAAGGWTCILAANGTVACWGGMQASSDAGVPCGAGTQATGGTCYPAPTAIAGVSGATILSVGGDHACAVVPVDGDSDAGNQVACWGKNDEAQVSPSACPQSDCVTPAVRDDLPTTTSIVAGNAFTCALAPDGSVRCFGDNVYGELGHAAGTTGDLGSAGVEGGLGTYYNPAATPAAATSVASLVGGGAQVACGLLGAGTAECWGQVTTTAASNPATIPGLPTMKALGSYDSTYVCGFAASDGSIWCWTLGSTPNPTQFVPSTADAGDAGGPG